MASSRSRDGSGKGIWDEARAQRLRKLVLDGLKLGNEGDFVVASAVAEMRAGLNGRNNLLKAWLLDVVELPAPTAARVQRMAAAHARLPDRDVWLAIGWDGVRKLVDALVTPDSLAAACGVVRASCNDEGLVLGVSALVKDLVARYGEPAQAPKRNTARRNLEIVSAELRALVARHPDLLTEVSLEARRIVGLPLPVPAADEVAAA